MQQFHIDHGRGLGGSRARAENPYGGLLQLLLPGDDLGRCTPNCLVNSASVFSPLIAARATFALKLGLYVLRVQFLMLSPDPPQHHRCQAGNPLLGLSEFLEIALFAWMPDCG